MCVYARAHVCVCVTDNAREARQKCPSHEEEMPGIIRASSREEAALTLRQGFNFISQK